MPQDRRQPHHRSSLPVLKQVMFKLIFAFPHQTDNLHAVKSQSQQQRQQAQVPFASNSK
jgi:hypothetical protein